MLLLSATRRQQIQKQLKILLCGHSYSYRQLLIDDDRQPVDGLWRHSLIEQAARQKRVIYRLPFALQLVDK